MLETVVSFPPRLSCPSSRICTLLPNPLAPNEDEAAALSGTFSDLGDDVVTLSASIGSLTQDSGASGEWNWTYTPPADFNGSQPLTITASDGEGGTATATVSLVVEPVNDPPLPGDDDLTTGWNDPLTIPIANTSRVASAP